MSQKTKDEVIADIVAHIKNCGGTLPEWYCGITNDIDERLFGDHNVSKTKDADAYADWIYRGCKNKAVAQSVEKAFLDAMCKGGTGGGASDSSIVYAYRIRPYTVE